MRRCLIPLLALALAACNLAATEPAPTLSPNRIEFITPSNNVQVAEGTELIIELVAHDPIGVARVQLLVDDLPHLEAAPIDAPTVPVFVVDMNWLAEGEGRHGLTAVSYRADGSFSATESIIVVVEATAEATELPPQ
jgi:hypothetical protein